MICHGTQNTGPSRTSARETGAADTSLALPPPPRFDEACLLPGDVLPPLPA